MVVVAVATDGRVQRCRHQSRNGVAARRRGREETSNRTGSKAGSKAGSKGWRGIKGKNKKEARSRRGGRRRMGVSSGEATRGRR